MKPSDKTSGCCTANTILPLACILLFSWLAGCTTMQAIPIADPPTESHLTGKFVWHDLVTSNVEASKQFYQTLFGWTYKQTNSYTVVLNNGIPIAGMVQVESDAQNQPARWLASLSVTDVEQAAKTAQEAGGVVHEGPTEMKNRGHYALISDPNGAELVLLYSTSGDPIDSTPKTGAWLWNELWTQDVQKSLDFYQKLAGYDLTPLSSDYVIAHMHNNLCAGIRPVLIDGINSRWIPIIRVDDPDTIVKDLELLGGQRLLETLQPDDNTKIILAADPTGALFMMQNWPDTTLTLKKE